jgi:cytochrome c biogenesis protein CcmG/thiol:disulfide interchange protein DsbE
MSTPEASVVPVATSRRSPARWIAVAVLVMLVLLVGLLATRPAADSKVKASPLVGQAAPSVSGTALDGRAVDLADFKGRYVVLNFFATWCQPCREEHPDLVEFSRQNSGPSDPAIIAIAYDKSDVNAARSFFAQNGGSWPVVPDDKGHVAIDYGVRGLPETYVIDPQGNISQHVSGGVTLAKLNELTGKV